jgi:hypothetical protein
MAEAIGKRVTNWWQRERAGRATLRAATVKRRNGNAVNSPAELPKCQSTSAPLYAPGYP